MTAVKFFDKDYLKFSVKDKIISGLPPETDIETDESVAALILKNLNENPDFIGEINVHTGKQTTFAEYKERSIRCALWLKKQGIGKDDVVSMSVPLQTDDYVPCLATLFLGAVFNPWYHRITQAEARYFFNVTQPKVMFAWDEEIDLLVSAAKDTKIDCKFVVVGKHPDYLSLQDLMAEQSQVEIDEFCHVEPDDPKTQVGVIFFSSGTTGNPKGTLLSYDLLKKNRYYYLLTRNNLNVLWYSSFSWITGTNFFISCIRKHSTRILHSEFHDEETGAIIEKFQVHIAFLTPTMLNQMWKSNTFIKYNFSRLEILNFGGCKPRNVMLEAVKKAIPHTILSNAYGMTEAGGLLTLQTRDCKTTDSIGYVVGGVNLKVIDPASGRLLGVNEEGEVCFKLDHMMIGYLRNPEESKKMIDEEGWLHSGDLGFYDENGEISITDRMKQVIIVQNYHVSPSQIEEILLQHPGVADAAVVSVPHKIDVETPLAFVVKKPGVEVTADELKELPVKYCEHYRLTGGVIFVNEIPYTSNKKKCIKVLKEMAKAYVQE